MRGYWPTEQSRQDDPVAAEPINNTPKIVFSKTLAGTGETEHWKNVKQMNEIQKLEIEKLKETSEKDLALYGSNNLCLQLMEPEPVDEFRLMVSPAIGTGTPLFSGLSKKVKLTLQDTETLKSGDILLTYRAS